jgi:hypothetical protein
MFIIFESNYTLMKKVVLLSLFAFLLLMAGLASGSYWFQVKEVSPIRLAPNSEANFTVAVKGLGSQGAYVQVVFKNVSEGLTISCPKLIKYVFPTGVTVYNCSIKAGNIAPGNYSFEAETAAKGSPPGKKTAYVDVIAAKAPPSSALSPETTSKKEAASSEQNQTPAQTKKSPGPGSVLAAMVILLVWRRIR